MALMAPPGDEEWPAGGPASPSPAPCPAPPGWPAPSPQATPPLYRPSPAAARVGDRSRLRRLGSARARRARLPDAGATLPAGLGATVHSSTFRGPSPRPGPTGWPGSSSRSSASWSARSWRWSSSTSRPGSSARRPTLSAIRELAAPPGVVHRRRPGRPVGRASSAAPWLGSVVRGTGRIVADLGIRFRPIDLVGIAIGIGGQLLVALIYAPFIHHIHNFNAPTTKLTGGSHGGGFVVIAILTVVGAPFFEELFFRGLLFGGLLRLCAGSGARRDGPHRRRRRPPWSLDGLLFGLAHGELVQLAGLAVFGCVLAFVAYRTGRLGMNMVSHASFNLVAVLAIVLDARREWSTDRSASWSATHPTTPSRSTRARRPVSDGGRPLAAAPAVPRPAAGRHAGGRLLAARRWPRPSSSLGVIVVTLWQLHLNLLLTNTTTTGGRHRRPLHDAGVPALQPPVPRPAHRLGPGLVRRLPDLHLLLRPARPAHGARRATSSPTTSPSSW